MSRILRPRKPKLEEEEVQVEDDPLLYQKNLRKRKSGMNYYANEFQNMSPVESESDRGDSDYSLGSDPEDSDTDIIKILSPNKKRKPMEDKNDEDITNEKVSEYESNIQKTRDANRELLKSLKEQALST